MRCFTNSKSPFMRLACILLLGAFLQSCKKDSSSGMSQLCLRFSSEYEYSNLEKIRKNIQENGAIESLPDTNDFILTIKSENGQKLHFGRYGDRPDIINVPAGIYEVSVVSEVIEGPEFSKPVYGDSQVVTVGASESIGIEFSCLMMNSGIRLVYTNDFKRKFQGCNPWIESENGTLEYPYYEKRIAYFDPSRISVKLDDDGKEMNIVSRTLKRNEILSLTLNASSEDSDGRITILLDTTKTWITDEYTYGSQNDGSSKDKALSVKDLSDYTGMKDVWVKGYIVGGDLSSTSMNTKPPFDTPSNLAIADDKNITMRESAAAVELKSEKIREALNLVSNPENLGKVLYIHGDIEKYFNYPGIKNIDEFELR